MSESLFTSQTPVVTNANDGGSPGITTATTLMFGADGTVSGIRFYATTSVVGIETYTAELWSLSANDTGTRIADAAVLGTAITAGTWNVINFASPVAVDTLRAYRAAINNTGGRYVATAGFFNAAPLVNGNITGIMDSTSPFGALLFNGTFADASPPSTIPQNNFGDASYFVDVVFDVAGGDPGAASRFLTFF